MASKHVQAGNTNISCQTFGERENERFVLVRLSNYRGSDGHMSCGFDLTPDKARELAAHLIALADQMPAKAAA